MERCPPELWTRISAYACVDDGTTGRSLSLVSRYISQASDPFRLQSICVCGEKLEPFLEMLDALRPGVHRVRHLFLSDVEKETPERMRALNTRKKVHAWRGGGSGDEPFDDEREMSIIMDKVLGGAKAGSRYDCINRILKANSATLRNLTISLMHLRTAILFPADLPFLVDLTLVSLEEWLHHMLEIWDGQLPSLPSLRRLHVANVGDAKSFLRSISRIAPSLTHLRTTGRWCDASLLEYLSSNAMSKVFIQPGPPPYGVMNGSPMMFYARDQLAALKCKAKFQAENMSSCPNVIMLRERSWESWKEGDIGMLMYGFWDSLRDWRRVVNGAEVFWDIEAERPEETRHYQMILEQNQWHLG